MTLLSRSARDAVQNIAPRNYTYDTAIRIPKNRFGNETVVVQALLDKLERIPQSGNRTDEVRKTFDRIEAILRQLEALGQPLSDVSAARVCG